MRRPKRTSGGGGCISSADAGGVTSITIGPPERAAGARR